MSIKQQYLGNMRLWWDARKGSLLDQSGNGITMSVVGNPYWANGSTGKALQADGSGSDYLINNTANFASGDSSGTIVMRFTLE